MDPGPLSTMPRSVVRCPHADKVAMSSLGVQGRSSVPGLLSFRTLGMSCTMLEIALCSFCPSLYSQEPNSFPTSSCPRSQHHLYWHSLSVYRMGSSLFFSWTRRVDWAGCIGIVALFMQCILPSQWSVHTWVHHLRSVIKVAMFLAYCKQICIVLSMAW